MTCLLSYMKIRQARHTCYNIKLNSSCELWDVVKRRCKFNTTEGEGGVATGTNYLSRLVSWIEKFNYSLPAEKEHWVLQIRKEESPGLRFRLFKCVDTHHQLVQIITVAVCKAVQQEWSTDFGLAVSQHWLAVCSSQDYHWSCPFGGCIWCSGLIPVVQVWWSMSESVGLLSIPAQGFSEHLQGNGWIVPLNKAQTASPAST